MQPLCCGRVNSWGPGPGSCAGGQAEACRRPALKDRAVCRQEKTCRQTANPRSGAAERGGTLIGSREDSGERKTSRYFFRRWPEVVEEEICQLIEGASESIFFLH